MARHPDPPARGARCGWRIVTVDHDLAPLDPAASRWFASIGGRAVTVPGDHPVYGRWFAGHDAIAVLQSPDFYLYGTADGRDGRAALLDRLRTRLGAPMTPPPEGACP